MVARAVGSIQPGLYIGLDRKGNKTFTRVLSEVRDPAREENNIIISPEVRELKPGLYTYLDKNGSKVLVRDLS